MNKKLVKFLRVVAKHINTSKSTETMEKLHSMWTTRRYMHLEEKAMNYDFKSKPSKLQLSDGASIAVVEGNIIVGESVNQYSNLQLFEASTYDVISMEKTPAKVHTLKGAAYDEFKRRFEKLDFQKRMDQV